LLAQNPQAVGPRLGQISVTQNIPAKALADMLRISEPTVYRWFYGESEPRSVYIPNIKKVLRLLRVARTSGDLPLHGTYDERIDELREIILKHSANVPSETQ
jgi:transcriptional regulator with XRE-family HTH domain